MELISRTMRVVGADNYNRTDCMLDILVRDESEAIHRGQGIIQEIRKAIAKITTRRGWVNQEREFGVVGRS